MVAKFEAVMAKMAVLGQNTKKLVDCSDVIPVPASVKLPPPTLPAGKSLADVEAAVSLAPSQRAVQKLTAAPPLILVCCYSIPCHQCCPW